jgi:hypothetical protein
MPRSAILGFILSASLLASGSLLDVVQAFAWGRMVATYSQSMSLGQAVKTTFSGDDPCGICKAVQAARNAAPPDQVAGTPSTEKIVFVAPSTALVVPAALETCTGLIGARTLPTSAGRAVPPVPPPRWLA